VAIADVASATRDTVGRYFSLVSALPSVLLCLYIYALAVSGAWDGTPSVKHVTQAVSKLGIADLVGLLVISAAIALALHPLQFSMVQLMEGYWGVNIVAEYLRSARMEHHWRRLSNLRKRENDGQDLLDAPDEADDENADDENIDNLRQRFRIVSRIGEAGRVLTGQPLMMDEIMPTRLGNILRYYELAAGQPYGLSALSVMPYLAQVARADDKRYLDDQRSQLDLAVRMSVTALIAFVATVAFMCRDGFWLLVSLVPCVIAYLSYRGAIIAAGQYGRAIAVIIALNRFSLYEQLRMPVPASTEQERTMNKGLAQLMDYDSDTRMIFRRPVLRLAGDCSVDGDVGRRRQERTRVRVPLGYHHHAWGHQR